MSKDRDQRGRFVRGNQVCRQGWHGYVEKRFAGDEATAKRYVGQRGAYVYAAQYLEGTPFAWKLGAIWKHPGTEAEFAARHSLTFTLHDIPPLAF